MADSTRDKTEVFASDIEINKTRPSLANVMKATDLRLDVTSLVYGAKR